MFHSLSMFLAAETTVSSGQAQATIQQPPASRMPVPGSSLSRLKKVKYTAGAMAAVVGNAIGFGLFLATCWTGLYLLHMLMPPQL